MTKDELKEGLHRAHVDLGEEWEDTNIDECLQHLHGRAEDHEKVGLREFVVMLAVGRVCRPLKRVSERGKIFCRFMMCTHACIKTVFDERTETAETFLPVFLVERHSGSDAWRGGG